MMNPEMTGERENEGDEKNAWEKALNPQENPFMGEMRPDANDNGTLVERNAEKEMQSDATLRALKKLFQVDLSVKRDLLRAAPTERDLGSEEARMDYMDQAYKDFRGFERDFESIDEAFDFGKNTREMRKQFFEREIEDFAQKVDEPERMRELYRKRFTQMRPEFEDELRKDFCGYLLMGGTLDGAIKQAASVNELLHAYHSFVMNNNQILQKVPEVEEKTLNNGESVVLRGEDGGLGREMFEAIPEDLDMGITDVVSIDGAMAMMVRDRGHALVIKAEPFENDPERVMVNYNIPKVINREMVEQLPGIQVITENGADGRFETPRSSFGETVVDFIGKVPTDADLPFLKELLARQESMNVDGEDQSANGLAGRSSTERETMSPGTEKRGTSERGESDDETVATQAPKEQPKKKWWERLLGR